MNSRRKRTEYLPHDNNLPLEIKALSNKYNSKADYAVSDISFCAHAGEVVGLLGPNGAGKSTILKSITGMIPFEEGEISVCGYSVKDNPVAAKYNFGFVTDNHTVFVKMTGMQYLNFMADVFGVPEDVREERIIALDKIFKLGDAICALISSYSHGMKQKICMMGSLIHRPPLWILDEPMLGLDPLTQSAVENFMRSYAAENHTILFSSHNLDAVERICDRVVIINHGKIAANLVKSDFAENGHDTLVKYFYIQDDSRLNENA